MIYILIQVTLTLRLTNLCHKKTIKCHLSSTKKILQIHMILTLSQTTNSRPFQTESSQTTISNLLKVAESSPYWYKALWEKEKLLVTSNFFFSHSVFKRLVWQTRKNQGLFGKGLRQAICLVEVHKQFQS